MASVGIRAFASIFEHFPSLGVHSHFLGMGAALDVERIAQSAAATLAFQFLVGYFSGVSLQCDLPRLRNADLGFAPANLSPVKARAGATASITPTTPAEASN